MCIILARNRIKFSPKRYQRMCKKIDRLTARATNKRRENRRNPGMYSTFPIVGVCKFGSPGTCTRRDRIVLAPLHPVLHSRRHESRWRCSRALFGYVNYPLCQYFFLHMDDSASTCSPFPSRRASRRSAGIAFRGTGKN